MMTKIYRILFFVQLFAAVHSHAQDSLYFDLSQMTLTYAGGQQQLSIPVYFSSNGSVNAIDFWFQFNTVKYTYTETTAEQTESDFFTHYNAEIDYLSSTISTAQNDVFLNANEPFVTLHFTINNPCDEVLTTDFTGTAGLINGEDAICQWTSPNTTPIGISISTPQPWCVGAPIAFAIQNAINGQAITDYNWSAGSTIGSDAAFTASFPTAGTFGAEVSITTEAGCTSGYTTELSIQPGPNVTFDWTGTVASEPVVFNNTTTFLEGNITSYAWDFGNGGTSTEESPIYTYPIAGNFDITLTAAGDNGCSTSATQTISIVSSIDEHHHKLIAIYPNPASDRCIITIPANEKIAMYNAYGQQIVIPTNSTPQGIIELHVEGLSAGLYYIRIADHMHPLLVK